jgi:membrane associated rhomboid family serine protease
MIEAICGCGWKWTRSESASKQSTTCPDCEKPLSIACAETLPDGAGAGDFDAVFDVISGPQRVGERIFLGGVAELILGKLEGSQILLPGKLVSRQHCRLTRVDFGPSRWSVADNKSTNGLFLDTRRIEFKELADGDLLRVGEYVLKYTHVSDELAPLIETPIAPPTHVSPALKVTSIRNAGPDKVVPGTGKPCPSCAGELPMKAKICVACGIKVDTGRPVLLSSDTDENVVHDTAGKIIQWVSWIIPITPLPMPLASEAFGKHKPWAIRGIAAVTVLASLIFMIGSLGDHATWDFPGKNLMLWPPGGVVRAQVSNFKPSDIREFVDNLDAEDREKFEAIKKRMRGTYPESQLERRAFEEMVAPLAEAMEKKNASRNDGPGEFHAYQLLTHAFLHDNGSILGCLLHLGGNLLFLLVFGSRVNALLGNIATLIIYPILAVGAAAAHLWLGHPDKPMLGASGAIMGLAGMYLILFPVHRVYCGMWLRLWLRFRTWLFMKVFVLRGFWVLLIYAAYDALMAWLDAGGGTAHFAHLGGFFIGATIALGLLFSRMIYCGGGDLLNVSLGKYAWTLIGRPAQWNRSLGNKPLATT